MRRCSGAPVAFSLLSLRGLASRGEENEERRARGKTEDAQTEVGKKKGKAERGVAVVVDADDSFCRMEACYRQFRAAEVS